MSTPTLFIAFSILCRQSPDMQKSDTVYAVSDFLFAFLV